MSAANRLRGQRTGAFLWRPVLRPLQEARPIPARFYPELCTWMVVRSGVISVFTSHTGNAPASPNMRPAPWLCSACLPTTTSIPTPIQPTTATTNYTHTPTVTNLSAFHTQFYRCCGSSSGACGNATTTTTVPLLHNARLQTIHENNAHMKTKVRYRMNVSLYSSSILNGMNSFVIAK